MKIKFIIPVLLLLLCSPAVYAACFVDNVPANTKFLSGTGKDFAMVGDVLLCKFIETAYVEKGGTQIAQVELSFAGGDINAAGTILKKNLNKNKVVVSLGDDPGLPEEYTIMIPYNGEKTAVLCEGATALTQLTETCGTDDNVVQKTYKIGSDVQVTQDNNGRDVIEFVVSGTGIILIDGASLLGGGSGDASVEDEDTLLKLPAEYVTRKNLEHSFYYFGGTYTITVLDVGTHNEDVVISFPDLEIDLLGVVDGSYPIDVDGNGDSDIVVDVIDIDYPEVYLSIDNYVDDSMEFPSAEQVVGEGIGDYYIDQPSSLFSRFKGNTLSPLNKQLIKNGVFGIVGIFFLFIVVRYFMGDMSRSL